MSHQQQDTLERVRAITANFFFWQGLRWVPMGAALLLVAWVLSPAAAVPEAWQSPILIGAMVAALAISGVAGRWYGRAYGRVRARPGMHVRRSRIKWLLVYPVLLGAFIVDALLRPPVLVSALAFAGAIEAYRRSTGGGRRHYLVASAVFAVSTFAPTFGVVHLGASAVNMVIALLGATYAIGGILDHLELRRTLPLSADAGEADGDPAGLVTLGCE